MTDFNLATRNQNFVHDIETDAELSLDQLAEINGGFNMDWLFKGTKIAAATTGTASLPFKLFNKSHKFIRNEIVPTLAWKLKWRI
mgnify:FL=1|jgi:hypothetical protein|tara:strand:+ start:480 stop:734 length:255 start_codon:yes stop_codon:yes gene_type:complete